MPVDNIPAPASTPVGSPSMPTAAVNPAESFTPAEFGEAAPQTTSSVNSQTNIATPTPPPTTLPKPADVKPPVKPDDKPADQNLLNPFEDPTTIKPPVDPKKATTAGDEDEHPDAKLAEGKPKRDYNVLPESLRPLTKKFNNAQYNAVVELARENSELRKRAEGGLPQNYIEHPQAYTLTPEYRNIVAAGSTATFEQRHWEKQVVNIKQGKDWEDLVGFNEQGQPQFQLIKARKDPATGEPIVDHAAEMQVMGYLQNARGLVNSASTQLKQLQSNFGQMHRGYSEALLKEADRLFPHLASADSPHKPLVDKCLSLIPEWQRNSPLAIIAARAAAQCMIYQNMFREQAAQKAVATNQEALRVISQPSPSTIASGGSGQSGSVIFDPKEF